MSLVVQSGSKQYVVNYGQTFIVDRLVADEGSVVDLDLVYAFGDDSKVTKVQAKVVKHQKGEKIYVVKYKSKSNYHRRTGFRANETILELVK